MRLDLVRKIEFAIRHHGGTATLKEIYDYVEKSFYQLGLDGYKDWKSQVRKHIHMHSSDCDIYRGERDLFYAVEGKGKGIWGLRQSNN